MKRALVIGAVFVDVVVNVPALPQSGGDVTAAPVSTKLGGCAYNVHGALRAAGGTADLFAPVGNGQYADLVRRTLQQRQVALQLPVTGADNGWDLAMVEPGGERTFLTVNGIEQCWQPEWFANLDWTRYGAVYLSGYEMERPDSARVILAALAQRQPGIDLFFDPSPRVAELPAAVLEQLLQPGTVVHCNEAELAVLVPGVGQLTDQLTALYTRTRRPVVVTRGRQGTCYYDGRQVRTITAETATVVNTVGAGDTHCGGLMAGLLAGLDWPAAVRQANQLAAKVVQQTGGCL